MKTANTPNSDARASASRSNVASVQQAPLTRAAMPRRSALNNVAGVAGAVLAVGVLAMLAGTGLAQGTTQVFNGYNVTADWDGNGAVVNGTGGASAIAANGVYFTSPGPGYINGIHYITGARNANNQGVSAVGQTHRFAVVPAGTDPATAAYALLGQGSLAATLTAEQVTQTTGVFRHPVLGTYAGEEVCLAPGQGQLVVPSAGQFLFLWVAQNQVNYSGVVGPESVRNGGVGQVVISSGVQRDWLSYPQITHYGTPAMKLTLGLTLPVTPPSITTVLSGNNAYFSWPSNYVGCRLESNSVSLTAGGSWFTMAGSASTNQVALPVNAARSNVFFRLAYP